MNVNQFRQLQESFNKWIAGYKSKGGKVCNWECPGCNHVNETPKPNKSDIAPGRKGWDSVKTCNECGASSFVFVPPSGKCEVLKQLSAPIINN